MKRYRFRFSVTVYILMGLVIALCIASIVWNIFNVVELAGLGEARVVGYIIIIVITAVMLLMVTAGLISSYYVIEKDKIVARFGFVKTSIKMEDVVAVTHYVTTEKLVVYYGENKYSVVVISPSQYDSFQEEVHKKNQTIIANKISKEEE